MSRSAILSVVVLGALACNVVDDVVRAGVKAGARGADEAVTAGAGHLDDAARKAAGAVDDTKLSDAVEQAGGLAMEFGQVAFESDAPPPTSFVEYVSQPKYVNLITEPAAWAGLRDSTEAAKAAPWIFDARPQGEGVLVDNQTISFGELAATCWRLGTTCIFVGCEDDACTAATRAVYDKTPPPSADGARVDAYTKILVDARMSSAPPPAFVMFAGGGPSREFTLVRAKSK